LDEPTNDLDLATVEVVEEVLAVSVCMECVRGREWAAGEIAGSEQLSRGLLGEVVEALQQLFPLVHLT
jgi:hypothetical protein